MSSDLLTSDNLHLSESKKPENEKVCAINCTDNSPKKALHLLNLAHRSGFVLPVSHYVNAGIADNTQRAYASDLKHYKAWGGDIPAFPAQVAEYIAQHAGTLRPATLVRRLAAISKAHRVIGLPSPTTDELVRATLSGIKRTHGTTQNQAKALVRDELFLVLDALGVSIRGTRDRALLLIGFAGGFRRSELVGLNASDVEQVREGLVITLRRSKTDQQGQGRKVGIPLGRTRHCPVKALEAWMAAGRVEAGPVFRSVNRYGEVSDKRLSSEAVSLIIKQRATAVGLNSADYSGHSLRAGFATSAAQAGVATWKIRAQTGHASDAMLMRYIREGELFSDNAAGALL